MALNQQTEQRLGKVGLVEFFEEHRAVWTAAAQRTYNYVRTDFPAGAVVRRDDVAKVLVPMLQIHPQLLDKLSEESLTQKYWVTYFVDLIIDRVWNEISGGVDGNQARP